MTLNDAIEGRSAKTTELMQKGSLAVLALSAAMILVFGRHSGIMLAVVLALCIVVAPTVYVLGKRLTVKVAQRETEERLMLNTRTYLSHETPFVPVAQAAQPIESDIEILARVIDFQKLPVQDAVSYLPAVAMPAGGEPVVFDALPRRYAVRSLYEKRFANLAANLPNVVCMPLPEPAPCTGAEESASSAAERLPLSIECSCDVMDEVRIRAAEGYQRMRHGGVEVGGVLFGTHENEVVSIEAARPLECEYSSGPRFVLSPQDETRLKEMLENTSADPELSGLQPVGWYHSHTREEICLSEADVRIFNRFFPHPWQVALVVRPANLAPTRAAFFVREADGVIRTEPGDREFQLSDRSEFAA